MGNSTHSFLLKLSLKLLRVLKIWWRTMSLTWSQFLLTLMKRRCSLKDTWTLDLIGSKTLLSVTIGWDSFSSFSPISNQMSPLVRHVTGGEPVKGCLCWSGGSDSCHTSPKSLLFCELWCHPFFIFELFPPISWPGRPLSLLGDEGDSNPIMRPLP